MTRVVLAFAFVLALADRAAAQFDPRDSIRFDVFGGATAVSDRSSWGEARYGVGGASVRYVRSRDASHFGATAATMYGARYALDDASFEEFGSVADRFAATYVGGVAGFDSHAFAIEVTGGGVLSTWTDGTRRLLPGWGASATIRIGPTHIVAVVLKGGSSDAWISDRNGASIGLLHDHRRFRGLVSIGSGYVFAPSLLANRESTRRFLPESRWKNSILAALADFVLHVELAGHLGDRDVGVEVWLGTQLPFASVFYRQRFGETPRIMDRRARRRPPALRGRYGEMPPR